MKNFLYLLSVTSFFSVSSQTTNIPDQGFEKTLISHKLDDVIDGKVLTSNIKNIKSLNLSIFYRVIEDLTGIEDFTNLESLFVKDQKITNLDLSALKKLKTLSCGENELISLNISENSKLETLICGDNNLTSIDVSNNKLLQGLYLSDNNLTSINVSSNSNLTSLAIGRNYLTSLDISNNLKLRFLRCKQNSLTSLDVSNNKNLYYLHCRENSLTSLDISNNPLVDVLDCQDNNLTSLNIKNGNNGILRILNSTNNPNLSCIQVDDVFKPGLWHKDDITIYSKNCATANINTETSLESTKIFVNKFIELEITTLLEGINFKIYNLTGQEISQGTLKTNKIDLKTYSKGLYILQLRYNNQIKRKKFVIK